MPCRAAIRCEHIYVRQCPHGLAVLKSHLGSTPPVTSTGVSSGGFQVGCPATMGTLSGRRVAPPFFLHTESCYKPKGGPLNSPSGVVNTDRRPEAKYM